jgi:F420-dependent oxidoreductase-like protein
MRIGIGIGNGQVIGKPESLEALVEEARKAEADGFATGWFVNVRALDAMTAAAVCGRVTSRIELGTSVVAVYSRHPLFMAQQALTTQAAAGGRFVLGIGLSHAPVVEGMLGLSREQPYTYMKEYMAVLGPLINQGKVEFRGSHLQVTSDVAFSGMTPCPVMLAALGPKMLQLAGSQTDGTITWSTGPKTLRDYIVPHLNEAASSAGRPAPRIVAGLPIAVVSDVKQARESANQLFERYPRLPSYRAMLDREGATGLGDIAIVGDEDDVAEQLNRLGEGGVTDLWAVPYPAGADSPGIIERTRNVLARLAR